MPRRSKYAPRPPDEHIAALGAAYERLVARLHALNRLRSGGEPARPELAVQVEHARCLAEEAHMRWLALAQPYLTAACAGGKARGG